MITYHNPRLAPEPLLHLLPVLVDERYHVPVVFNARGRRLPLGWHIDRGGMEWIEIHLHMIWASTISASATDLWRRLLDVCLHEFGHVATIPHLDPAIQAGYHSDHGAHEYVERPAIAWQKRRVAELLTRDPRLAQPPILTGYLGGRHAAMMRRLRRFDTGSGLAFYVAERRKMATGAQLTAGEVLRHLQISSPTPRDFRALRSIPLGTPHRDRAGRRHTLYTWGDLDGIAEQFRGRSPASPEVGVPAPQPLPDVGVPAAPPLPEPHPPF